MAKEPEDLFLDIAVEQGLLTQDQAAACRADAARAAEMGDSRSISQIALAKRLLDVDQVRDIRNEMGRREVLPRLGGYKLISEVGAGAMGVVFRAIQLSTGRVVALKRLHHEATVDRTYILRFQREGRLAARINHPNVVQVHDVGQDAGDYFIAMEFVHGDSLDSVVRRAQMDEGRALEIIRGVASALAVAHEQEIIHRDVKPANIMLTRDGVAKLTDLGIAKQTSADEGLTRTGFWIGTPRYMSPEQCSAGHTIDGRADIYSLGCTLYRMVSGKPPFHQCSAAVVVEVQRTEPLPDPRKLNPGVSEGVVGLIGRMTAKRPSERFQDCAELIAAIDALRHAETPSATADRAASTELDVSAAAEGGVPETFVVTQPGALPAWARISARQVEAAARAGVEPAVEYELGAGVTLRMVLIPAGEFMMGSPDDEEGRFDNEGPVHKVRITTPFYMAVHKTTQAQYERVMDVNPSHFKGSSRPVECVTWELAMEFCNGVRDKGGPECRLPTEAEWEYACRAGTSTPFHLGGTISTDQANYNGNYTYGNGRKGVYRAETTDVGSFAANAFGLHDMHGNVWEWCQDCFGHDYYANSPTDDPEGPSSGSSRALRGGSWYNSPRLCRAANRGRVNPTGAYYGPRVPGVCVVAREAVIPLTLFASREAAGRRGDVGRRARR